MKRTYIFAVAIASVASVLALADTAAASAVPDWFGPIVSFAFQLPVVGPFLKQIVPYVGLITTIFTALTVCFTSCAGALKVIARFAGLQGLADQIQTFHDRVMPYLAF